MILVPVVVLIVSIVQRLAISLSVRTNFDTYGHLYFVKEVKDQKAGPFGAIDPSVVKAATFRHPFLWHWLIGFLPFSWVYRHWQKFNPVLDGIFTAVIALFCVQAGKGEHFGALSGFLYIFTPMWFSTIAIGPRVASLTPRLSSEIALNLYFMLLLVPVGLPEWAVLTVAILLGVYILLSSKFGVQAILLLSPLIAVFNMNLLPLFAFFLSFFVSIILTRGDFFITLSYQLKHLGWYFKENLQGRMAVSNRNNLRNLLKRLEHEKGIAYWGKLGYQLVGYNAFTALIIKMPVLPVALLLLTYSFIQNDMMFPSALSGPVLAGSLLFLLINIPALLFLGEAERYINHIAFFVVALAVKLSFLADVEWLIYILIIYGFIFMIMELILLPRLRGKTDKTGMINAEDKILELLKNIPEARTVLSYPYHAVGVWRIMLETHHKTVYPLLSSKDFAKEFEKRFASSYPYVQLEKLDEMADEIGVNVVILNRADVNRHIGNKWQPSAERWENLQVGNPYFDVYTCKNHN